MDSRAFLDFLKVAERLKCNTRHSYTSSGRHESVAEHSWRLTVMAYFMQDEFPEADIDKVIKMCMFHDMGEAITGDIPAFEKTSADSDKPPRTIPRCNTAAYLSARRKARFRTDWCRPPARYG